MFERWKQRFSKQFETPFSQEEFLEERKKLLNHAPLPLFWMFGKTGSGKTSVIKYLTGADEATIGRGFQPETRFASRYDFPTAETPLIQFLDTRGLGEKGYSPTTEIAEFEREADLMLLTVRLNDPAQEVVLTPLRQLRIASPHRPIVLLLTCLHQTFPGCDHPEVIATDSPSETWEWDTLFPGEEFEVCRNRIREQQARFDGLYDRLLPIDFTREEEGFPQAEFGGEYLKQMLIELLPHAYAQTFQSFQEMMNAWKSLHEQQSHPMILCASSMAATAGLTPAPWIDLPVVSSLQFDLIRRLAKVYQQELQLSDFGKTLGAVAAPTLLRQLLRGPLKLIPGVGQIANAAGAFATTFALGKASCWYFEERMTGSVPTKEELQSVFQEQLKQAEQFWKRHNSDDPSTETECR